MHPTRRRFLVLGAAGSVLGLAACVPSPVITGKAAEPYSPPPKVPVQSPDAAEAAAWTVALRAWLALLPAHAEAWEVPAGTIAWGEGATAQCDAHLARLLAEDPLEADPEPVFEASAATAPAAADLAAFTAAVDEHLAAGVGLLGALAAGADEQPKRLFYTSLATAAQGLRSRQLPPAPGDAGPILFPNTGLDTSLGVALTHAWALIQGLEFAIARFPSGDSRDLARAQLGPARALRDELLEAMAASGSNAPGQAVDYEMPTPMSNDSEIRAGLAALSGGMLDAWARVMAASRGDRWLGLLAAQVTSFQSWGGQLPYWPGWTQV